MDQNNQPVSGFSITNFQDAMNLYKQEVRQLTAEFKELQSVIDKTNVKIPKRSVRVGGGDKASKESNVSKSNNNNVYNKPNKSNKTKNTSGIDSIAGMLTKNTLNGVIAKLGLLGFTSSVLVTSFNYVKKAVDDAAKSIYHNREGIIENTKAQTQASQQWEKAAEKWAPAVNTVSQFLSQAVAGLGMLFSWDFEIEDSLATDSDKYNAYLTAKHGAMKTGLSASSAGAGAVGIQKNAAWLFENNEYADDYNTIVNNLTDAWLNASNAASKYGIIIDDEVLAGYAQMVEGLDIVNMKITDSMKSALTYRLIQEQIANTQQNGADSTNELAYEYKNLGKQLKDAAQSQYIFDRLINANTRNYARGTIYGDDMVPKDEDNTKNNADVKTTVLPTMWGDPGDLNIPKPKTTILPVIWGALSSLVIPSPNPVTVPLLWGALATLTIPALAPVVIPLLWGALKALNLPAPKPYEIPVVYKYPSTSPSGVRVQRTANSYATSGLFNVMQGIPMENATGYRGTNTVSGGMAQQPARHWTSGTVFEGGVLDPNPNWQAIGGNAKAITIIGGGTLAALGTGYAAASAAPAAAGAIGAGGSGLMKVIESLNMGYSRAAYGLADGGVGVKELNNVSLFENNKKEAVIPLETTAGITYLSNALDMAMGDESERKLDITINLSGVFLDNKEETYRKLSNELEPRITEKVLRKGGSGMGLSRR